MRQQRVYVLITTASAVTGIALILSLLSLGVDLGYHGRVAGSAPAPDGRLVVPAAAVDRRALVTSGGSPEGRLAAVVLDAAAPTPARAPEPEPEASPPARDRERAGEERARRLRRPGGPVPSVPAPAPVPAPAAPQPVSVPQPVASPASDRDDDDERGERESEGSGRQASGGRRGLALALGRQGGPDRAAGRQKDHGHGLGPSPQVPAPLIAFGRPTEATVDDHWHGRRDRGGHHGRHGHRDERSGRGRGFGRGRP